VEVVAAARAQGDDQGDGPVRVGRLGRDRREQSGVVDAGSARLYEALRSSRQGMAVAKVERGICQGCRITLPVSVLQKARSGAVIVQCSSCERILYVS